MTNISLIIEAIRQESLDGWLFCNFAHRDRLTDTTLGLDPETVSTRSWFYLLLATGESIQVVHSMERTILQSLPGSVRTYTSREELIQVLSDFSGKTFAVLEDPVLTVLSTISAGHLATIKSSGIKTVSAAGVVQRINLFKTHAEYDSHEQAAAVLYTTVQNTWTYLSSIIRSGKTTNEGAIRDYILSCMTRSGLSTDHPPIVAAGPNTANPHYSVPNTHENCEGARIERDMLIQFDLWGKFPKGMYADISWVGYTGTHCPLEYQERFSLIRDARDYAVTIVDEAFQNRKEITGSAIDAQVRRFLFSHHVNPACIRHRTGHAIDTECHGSGANLDSHEFPDPRPLLEGSCFSIEPGIYCENYGMRTEINVYIRHGKPVISGLPIQQTILEVQD